MTSPPEKPISTALTPELCCSNIQRSLVFYLNVLGFTLQYERKEEGFAMLERQGSRIMLDEIPAHLDNPMKRTWLTGPLTFPFGRGINLEIKTEQIDALYAQVQHARAPIFLPLEERRYQTGHSLLQVKQFIVQDPDGYLLRFSQALN